MEERKGKGEGGERWKTGREGGREEGWVKEREGDARGSKNRGKERRGVGKMQEKLRESEGGGERDGR